jgi:GNAT superfamily N-acetyltransferase
MLAKDAARSQSVPMPRTTPSARESEKSYQKIEAAAQCQPSGVTITDFASLPSKERPAIVEKVAKLERKIFPSSEGFDYDVELKKKNIGLILAFKGANIVAYLVYQRMKRVIWLHKLCVVEQERQKGIGRCLIHSLSQQMESRGGESIQLWVDEHRLPARALYDAYGFQQVELRADYYAPGRAGIKMELVIGR